MSSSDIPSSAPTSSFMPSTARPPTASTPLWAHFMKQKSVIPTTLADVPLAVPPSAPLDKNATSMRILLHDTQANLEKFSNHVQNLVEGVKEAKSEIKIANSLFERDREGFMGDIADLINRNQREIQKSVGNPAQDERIQSFINDFTIQLSRLDQRLDALQTFNQTHSQALQTQMQAVQILIDKQASITAAVLPLLPLLQAVPLYIDAAKASICENVIKALSKSSATTGPKSQIGTSSSPACSPTVAKRKRAISPSQSLVGLSPSQKRIRKEPAETSSPASVQNRYLGGNTDNPSHQHVKPPTPRPVRRAGAVENAQTLNISLTRGRSVSTSKQFATPRRPLSELLPSLLPPANVVTPRTNTSSRLAEGSALSTPRMSSLMETVVRRSIRKSVINSGTSVQPHCTDNVNDVTPQLQNCSPSVTASARGSSSPVHGLKAGKIGLRDNGLASCDTALSISSPSPHCTREVVGSQAGQRNLMPNSDDLNTIKTNLPFTSLLGKGCRSPPRNDRRRFIPLVDSDEEE